MSSSERLKAGGQKIQDRIHLVNDRFRTTAKTAVGMKESFERIERLIAVVRGITAKTDLLALNASIEAARAGQAGKGFAVVAHEVARLAEQSQDSIQNVDAVFAELKETFLAISSQIDQCTRILGEFETSAGRNGNPDQDVA